MHKTIDAPIELTDAEIGLVAGGYAGVGYVSTTGTTQSVGGGGNGSYAVRDASNGYYNSTDNQGAYIYDYI